MSISFQVFRGSKDGKIVVDTTTRTLQPNEVYIETTHSGLCGTDEHFLRSGHVLGHEGVGVIRQLGRDVTNVKVGQRVGFGYTHYVCGACEKCLSGMCATPANPERPQGHMVDSIRLEQDGTNTVKTRSTVLMTTISALSARVSFGMQAAWFLFQMDMSPPMQRL